MVTTAPTVRVLRAGVLLGISLASVTAIAGAERDVARAILEATGVKGGLIVHLGCGQGKLTAALRAGKSFVVHGLDTDADKVRRAREHIRKLGIYGPVSAELFDAKRLPHADNLVDLVVAEGLGGVATSEAMRVLAPGGVLYVKQGAGPGRRSPGEGGWKKTVKRHPGNTDEWTHFLHDASGNAVAHDEVVAPPGRVQWIAPPQHTRSHEHTPSINALVSAGGRIFYIVDQAGAGSIRQPPKWHLVARDAYNGLLLWQRPFRPWFPHIVNWGQTLPQLQRRLVAAGDRVYVTLGFHAPLSAVDAATGKTIKVYPKTEGADEILYHKGTLLLVVRSVTDDRVAELAKMARLSGPKKSPLNDRESAQPLVSRFRTVESKAPKTLLAMDADSGRVLWKKAGTQLGGLRPLTLCATGDRVFYQKGGGVVCLDRKTGRELWSAASGRLRVVGGETAICTGGKTVTALSAKTGKVVWTQPATLCQIRDAFVIKGSLWLGGFRPFQGRTKGKRGPAWGPYFATQRDLATGKILKQVEPEGPGHHHRCWQNKATERYILAGRRGVEFVDLETGEFLWHSWVRGVCRYGVMPSNGLLYAPPHACGCYIAAKLTGFYALAPAARGPKGPAPADRLEKGPAYDSVNPQSAIRNPQLNDWPTYRGDGQRSGRSGSPVRATLGRRWRADVGGRLSSCTVAGGKVFVASVDEHRVCAIDADSGRPAWDFTADGRVDSPPTVYQGRAIFGSRDGCVYSLRASDGALAWRLRTARGGRRITARGQLESVSPVHGSVLIRDLPAGAGGAAYFTAGRSSYLDGGIDLYRVQPATGKVLSKTPIYSPDAKTGRQPKQFGPCYMPGALGEILTGDDQYVYLRDMVFDGRGARRPKGKPHLLTLTGFLDGSWPHRSYWIFGTRCSISTGCSGRDRNLVSGRLLAFDDSTIYGYGRTRLDWSNRIKDGAYRLFARKRGEKTNRWSKPPPVRVRAMVLAKDVLFVAGPGADAAMLVAVSAANGQELDRCRLESPPVFDGMAAAGGRLYIALENGRLVRYGPPTRSTQ